MGNNPVTLLASDHSVTRYDPCFRVDPKRIRLGGVHCLKRWDRRTGNQGPRMLDSRNDGKSTGVVFPCRSATMPRHAGRNSLKNPEYHFCCCEQGDPNPIPGMWNDRKIECSTAV
jgi:hypothetical protein